MSDHKFTGERSDMAHRIKTLNGVPYVPAILTPEMISNPAVPFPAKKDPK